MEKRTIISTILWVVSILSYQGLYAFENIKTHPALTDKAAIASAIDDYLNTQMGLTPRNSQDVPDK
jgi:hypothetical protein